MPDISDRTLTVDQMQTVEDVLDALDFTIETSGHDTARFERAREAVNRMWSLQAIKPDSADLIQDITDALDFTIETSGHDTARFVEAREQVQRLRS